MPTRTWDGVAAEAGNGLDALLRRPLRIGGLGNVSLGAAIVVALLAVATALRLAWGLARDGLGASGEAFNVAKAIAEGHGFADAYRPGQGATAHLMPLSPSLAGGVYRLFGVNDRVAEAILTSWALALMLGTYLLVFRIFERLGMSLAARIGALCYLSLAPVYIAQEAVDFRIWEGGLAVFLCAATVDALLAGEQARPNSTWRLAGLAILAALLFFVNPILGIGGYACALLFATRCLTVRQFVLAGLMAAGALAALEVPWTMRNAAVMGQALPLRSNAGLELALGQNPQALTRRDQGQVFLERLRELHPAVSESAYARLVATGGEVAYADSLGRETRAWIAAHPDLALRLSLRHIRQTFAPDPWQFGPGLFPGMRAVLASLSGLLGLAGLLLALMQRRRSWLYVAIVVLVPAIALAPFQPISRYTYLFYPWLTFCAAYFVDRIRSFSAASRRLAG